MILLQIWSRRSRRSLKKDNLIMIYRKTWFSYVLWMVFTMLCVIFLVFAGNYVCVSYFADGMAQVDEALRPCWLRLRHTG